jgi:hypothetical protein
MSGEKYIGLDVHQATISVAVVDSQGFPVRPAGTCKKATALKTPCRVTLRVVRIYRQL